MLYCMSIATYIGTMTLKYDIRVMDCDDYMLFFAKEKTCWVELYVVNVA